MPSDWELRLLRCSFPQSSPATDRDDDNPSSSLSRAVKLIEQGNYAEVLALDEVRAACAGVQQHQESSVFEQIAQNSRTQFSGNEEQEMLGVAAGVASLFIFVQSNFTGPDTTFPVCPVGLGESWDVWARGELMIDGCDVLGKCLAPQYLLLAKSLLGDLDQEGGPLSRVWWISRALMAQQRVLSERSPTLLKNLKAGYLDVLRKFGSTTAVGNHHWHSSLARGEEDLIAAAAYLEAALMEYYYGHEGDAKPYLELAESFSGLSYSVIGALGYRRQDQVDPKAQLVLKDESGLLDESNADATTENENDVLRAPRLEEESSRFLHHKVLSPIQQAVVLARLLDIKKSDPDDEIRSWKMAPYIEAVDVQKTSSHMVRASCRLCRVEWEKCRGRTRERAFLTMEALVSDIRGGISSAAERMRDIFAVSFPCYHALLKEYANFLVGFGNVGEALKLFEELELWHSLIDCHRLLGDKAIAASLIKERVEISPNDQRLWCSLGDVTDDEQCFLKSWEVSRQRFAPAQRCLARSAYERKDYVKAVGHWELALALNPLNSDGWFSLGFSAMKAHDMDNALNALVRAVQLDPENGEAWNNIAALNMRRKKYREANVAFQEALKFKRNSWQMWENSAQVSFELGNYSQAVMALGQAFDLSEKHMNMTLLTRLVEVLEDESTDEQLDDPQAQTVPLSLRQAENLTLLLGKLLSKVALSGNMGGEIWGLKARWHKHMGEDAMCAEALLKQVRALQGLLWKNDRSRFQKVASAVLQLSNCYLETGGKRELSAARLQLQSVLKQAEQFEDTDEFRTMQLVLGQIQSRLSDASAV